MVGRERERWICSVVPSKHKGSANSWFGKKGGGDGFGGVLLVKHNGSEKCWLGEREREVGLVAFCL